MRIFVSAYACEPNLGSEIGVGWHWVLEMSKYFELWVLTRESNRKNIEPWIAEHPEYSGIHWLYYDLPRWARWWKKGLRGVRTYYNLWQWRSNAMVERTMKEQGIEVFHHLTYGNAMWNVSQYGQRQHFIWGPIGGLETIGEEFARFYSLKERLLVWTRRMAVKTLPLNNAFVRRCERANLIICKTEATRSLIPEPYRHKTLLMTDVACEERLVKMPLVQHDKADVTRFITVGHLDAWRGFDLTVEAFEKLAQEIPNVELCIVGEGGDRMRLEGLVGKMQSKAKIRFAGQVSGETYRSLMQESHVVINAAVKEGAVTVAFDAISYGKPLVCIETGGYTRALNNIMCECVALSTRDQVIEDLKNGMKRFCDEKNRQRAAAEEAGLMSSLSWTCKGLAIRNAILENCQ